MNYLDHQAIMKAYPETAFVTDYKGAFKSDGTKIDVEQSKVDEARVELSKLDYEWKREQEYPPVVDQLDLIYHSGIDAWKAKIKETKDKYPKS